MTSRTLSTSAGLASAGVSGPIVNNAVVASIAACNAGDRAAWLACYHPDVVWEIIGDRTMRGIAELATLWEAMVLGTGERSVSFEGYAVDAAGKPWIAAVVTHAGGLDTIVCCELDDRGRIRIARSYRQGDRDPSSVPAAFGVAIDDVDLAISLGANGAALVRPRTPAGTGAIVEWADGVQLGRYVELRPGAPDSPQLHTPF